MTLLLAITAPVAPGAKGAKVLGILAPMVSGVVLRPQSIAGVGLDELVRLRAEGLLRLAIADLALDSPADLRHLRDAVDVVTLAATAPDLTAAAESVRSSGLEPAVKVPVGCKVSVEELVAASRDLRFWGLVIDGRDLGLIRGLRSSHLEARIAVDFSLEVRPRLGDGICAGASYEIIGRPLEESGNPLELLKALIYEQRVGMSRCSGQQGLQGPS